MDLRIVKTRNHIREAFLSLRSKHPLEAIRVTELCEIAIINKTTFYKHFQDIYALSEEIENETILSIMDNFEHIDFLLSDPCRFVKGLYYSFKSHQEFILTLFSGRMNVLIEKVERQLKIHYPAFSSFPEKDIMLSFLLRGASQVLMESRQDETVLLNTVSAIVEHMLILMNAEGFSLSPSSGS